MLKSNEIEELKTYVNNLAREIEVQATIAIDNISRRDTFKYKLHKSKLESALKALHSAINDCVELE